MRLRYLWNPTAISFQYPSLEGTFKRENILAALFPRGRLSFSPKMWKRAPPIFRSNDDSRPGLKLPLEILFFGNRDRPSERASKPFDDKTPKLFENLPLLQKEICVFFKTRFVRLGRRWRHFLRILVGRYGFSEGVKTLNWWKARSQFGWIYIE